MCICPTERNALCNPFDYRMEESESNLVCIHTFFLFHLLLSFWQQKDFFYYFFLLSLFILRAKPKPNRANRKVFRMQFSSFFLFFISFFLLSHASRFVLNVVSAFCCNVKRKKDFLPNVFFFCFIFRKRRIGKKHMRNIDQKFKNR